MRIGQSLLARSGICVAGIYKQCADGTVVLEMLYGYLDRRSAKAVLGEHPCDLRAFHQSHQQEIGALGFADAGRGDAEGDTSYRMKLISRGRREVDCHGG